jgi:hypothetical protein
MYLIEPTRIVPTATIATCFAGSLSTIDNRRSSWLDSATITARTAGAAWPHHKLEIISTFHQSSIRTKGECSMTRHRWVLACEHVIEDKPGDDELGDNYGENCVRCEWGGFRARTGRWQFSDKNKR